MISLPSPCSTTTPAHNLVKFDSAAWGNLALVCPAHGAPKYENLNTEYIAT